MRCLLRVMTSTFPNRKAAQRRVRPVECHCMVAHDEMDRKAGFCCEGERPPDVGVPTYSDTGGALTPSRRLTWGLISWRWPSMSGGTGTPVPVSHLQQ